MTEPDVDRIARRLARAALRRRAFVVTAESCTGGGVAQAITALAGSSRWFERGLVTYSDAAKREFLGVRAATLRAHGAVSAETAREMAAGALRTARSATVAVAITGIAGPAGGSRAKPVGTVWFAWASRRRPAQVRGFRFSGDRRLIQRQAVAVALQGLADLLG